MYIFFGKCQIYYRGIFSEEVENKDGMLKDTSKFSESPFIELEKSNIFSKGIGSQL